MFFIVFTYRHLFKAVLSYSAFGNGVFFNVYIFEKSYIVHTGLELWSGRQVLNFHLLSAKITGKCHHAWLSKQHFLKNEIMVVFKF